MKQNPMTQRVTPLSMLAGLGLLVACGSDIGKVVSAGGATSTGGASTSGGTAGTSGTSVSDADPCSAGLCVPSEFPFVTRAIAISDACGRDCPLLAANTAAGETTATLSHPEAGTLCLSGIVAPGGWAQIGLIFAVKSQDRTEILKKFDAQGLGITQVAFTLDSPPREGVSVDAAITTATSCPGDPFGCFKYGFNLMTAPGSSLTENYALPGQFTAPFANFMQTVGTQSFDTSALDHLVFSVGTKSYNFCIRDFKFLDAQGNEVLQPQQADSGV
jgi:hypothetical protein